MANIVIVTYQVHHDAIASQREMLTTRGHSVTVSDVTLITSEEMQNYDLIIATGYDNSHDSSNKIILAYEAGTPLIVGVNFNLSNDIIIPKKLNHGSYTRTVSNPLSVKIKENDLFFQSYTPNTNIDVVRNKTYLGIVNLNADTFLKCTNLMVRTGYANDTSVAYLIEDESRSICFIGILGNVENYDSQMVNELNNIVNYMSGESDKLISGFVKIDNEPHSTNVIAVSADLKNPKIVGITQSDPADGSYSITTVYDKPFMVFTMQDYGLPWSASTAKVIGDVVHPTVPNGYIYKVTQTGNTGTVEPTWTAEKNVSINDGSVIYQSEMLLKPEIEGYVNPTPVQ